MTTNVLNNTIALSDKFDEYLQKSLRWWMPTLRELSNSQLEQIDKFLPDGELLRYIIQNNYIQLKEAKLLNAIIGIVDEYFEINNYANKCIHDHNNYIDEYGDLLFYITMTLNELYDSLDLLSDAFKLFTNTSNYLLLNNLEDNLQYLIAYLKKSTFHKKQYNINSVEFKTKLTELIAAILYDNLLFHITIDSTFDYDKLSIHEKEQIITNLILEVMDFNIKKLEDRQGIKRVNEVNYLGLNLN
jgi:NTP pyrophosphatase (non-canonical NTP hydrolase)